MELNKIYNDDCFKGIKNIPDNSIDLIVMDPPYEISTNKGRTAHTKIEGSILKVQDDLVSHNLTSGYDFSLLDELVRVMKQINIYIWCNKAQLEDYLKYFVDKHNCKYEILIWNKTNAIPLYSNKYLIDKEYCLYFKKGAKCKPLTYDDARTVYISSTNAKDRKKYKHPTIKPLDFIRRIIRNSSKENDIVLDCFMGSGTTAIASILENRQFIGFEINKEYFDIANKRIVEVREGMNNE